MRKTLPPNLRYPGLTPLMIPSREGTTAAASLSSTGAIRSAGVPTRISPTAASVAKTEFQQRSSSQPRSSKPQSHGFTSLDATSPTPAWIDAPAVASPVGFASSQKQKQQTDVSPLQAAVQLHAGSPASPQQVVPQLSHLFNPFEN
eukprot:TRINITY_DN14061_c0_g1_i9.p1 TRINITY_DN14061_c0_g1~~TRINITY_DN14061_c0_g1_i9.p1  ORF type:complete len:146 (+),score=24.50 TRINITY_DN14061_c0_g1_i9:524-961(+)